MTRTAGFLVAFALAALSFAPMPMFATLHATGAQAAEGCGCSMNLLSIRVNDQPTIGPEAAFTLAGHSSRGWGLSNATISNPGPNLTVHLGDLVTLTLVANDTATHNWFLDYNGDGDLDATSEPFSPDYNTLTGPKTIDWNFTADRPGTWTYRCAYHPTTMIGTLVVLPEGRPLNQTLYGEVAGWGETNVTIANPGPEMVVGMGALVTLTLGANDTSHTWFIDYNNNREADADEPESPDFGGPGDPEVIVWNFTANRPGTFTYRCAYHPTTMTGTIKILGEAPPPDGGLGVGLIPAIMLITLGGVLVFAIVYHVRSVRASKRRK